MGQKLQDGKKVLQMSQTGPHSKSRPRQTAGPSNLSFWILGNRYEAMLQSWDNFKGPKCRSEVLEVEKLHGDRLSILLWSKLQHPTQPKL